MSSEIQPESSLSATSLNVGIVASRFNLSLVDSLLNRVTEKITHNGNPKTLIIERVPGAHEIPSALSLLLAENRFSCMIALGVILKGATSHHHLVAESAGNAIQNLILKYNTPIINGIVVTDTVIEAEERIIGKLDRGHEFAHAAIEMGHLHKKWTKT